MSESPEEIGATTEENTNPRNAGAKRKRLATGTVSTTRSVANLTPDQLEKKRKNDREAQRAIRERTKAHIDRLNDKIRDLEQSDPYQQLQGTIRQKDAIQAENEELKRKMAQVISLLQPHILSGQGLNDLASAAAERKDSGPKSPLPPGQQTYTNFAAQAPSPVADEPSPASQSSHTRTYGAGSSATLNNQQMPQWGSPSSSFDQHLGNRSLAIDQELFRESRIQVGFVLDHTDHFVQGTINTSAKSNSHLPQVHQMLPRASPQDSCPLDKLLLDFLLKTQRLAAGGVPTKDLAGPAYPNWNVMVNPNTTRYSPHLLSKVFTDILLTFPDLSDPPVQVAVVFIMFLIMRWQIDPTRENYERIPEWIRPRPEQIFVYHPHWLDYLPWPALRTAAVMRKPHMEFDNFFIPYTTSISLNWPYPKETVLSPPIDTGTPRSPYEEPIYTISPGFEAHLRDLNNWSLGPEFRRAFPEWGPYVRISQKR